MSLPFDGAISKFFADTAPKEARDAIKSSGKKDIISTSYPYQACTGRENYEAEVEALQLELAKLQTDVNQTSKRVVVNFEGRDAAGKGSTIKPFRDNLNPCVANVVVLSKFSDREQGEWYFQRYIKYLPSAGEMTLFDRRWYNRAVVEKVFGFYEDTQREAFFRQLPELEDRLVDEGIHFVKLWLNIGRSEQLRRFLSREKDPLKQWKLNWIDVEGLNRWDGYSHAIGETFERSHRPQAPWAIVRSDDKLRAYLSALQDIYYAEKYSNIACVPDAQICGDPDLWAGS